jgi:hypothetical protein
MGFYVDARIELAVIAIALCGFMVFLLEYAGKIKHLVNRKRCAKNNHKEMCYSHSTRTAVFYQCACGAYECMVVPEDGMKFVYKTKA